MLKIIYLCKRTQRTEPGWSGFGRSTLFQKEGRAPKITIHNQYTVLSLTDTSGADPGILEGGGGGGGGLRLNS